MGLWRSLRRHVSFNFLGLRVSSFLAGASLTQPQTPKTDLVSSRTTVGSIRLSQAHLSTGIQPAVDLYPFRDAVHKVICPATFVDKAVGSHLKNVKLGRNIGGTPCEKSVY